MTQSAYEIYQGWLDATSDAILHFDLKTLRPLIALPYLQKFIDGEMLVETEEDLSFGQQSISDMLKGHGATHLVRLCGTAEFLSSSYIQGTHATHAFRHASPAVPRFDNRMVLKHVDGLWKIVEIESAIYQKSWPLDRIRVDADRTENWDAHGDDVRRNAVDACVVYQAFLDELTRAMHAGDVNAYLDLHDFPFHAHTDLVDDFDQGSDEARAFFNHHLAHIRHIGADDFGRYADRAEFIGTNMICGYHIARYARDGKDLIPPVKSCMMLRFVQGAWKLKMVINSVNDTSEFKNFKVTPKLVTQREIYERTKKWRNSN